MGVNEHEIAFRVAGLPREKQKAFLLALRMQDIDFGKLPIVSAKRDSKVALSYAQTRQWFLWQLDPGSTAYHLSGALRLRGAATCGKSPPCNSPNSLTHPPAFWGICCQVERSAFLKMSR